MSREFANIKWIHNKTPDGRIANVAEAQLAVLMDIRDELQRLNEILYYRPPDTVVDIVRTLGENEGESRKRKEPGGHGR